MAGKIRNRIINADTKILRLIIIAICGLPIAVYNFIDSCIGVPARQVINYSNGWISDKAAAQSISMAGSYGLITDIVIHHNQSLI